MTDDYLGIHELRFKGHYNHDDFMEGFEEDFEPLGGEDEDLGSEG